MVNVTRTRSALVTVALFALAGCGSDAASSTSTSSATTVTTAPSTTSVVTSTTVAPTTSTTTAATTTTTTTTSTSTSTSVPAAPGQIAMWPDAGTVFTTPEAAATDFVDRVLGVPPALGDFEAGDSRSGEIAVLSTGEDGTWSTERSRLLLRQLDASDGTTGWFVIAAVHDQSTVTTPEAGSTVAAGPITVAGVGHGFEASMMVSAYAAGDPTPIDADHTMAGTMEDPGDYSVTLDLTGVAPGTVVMLMVRGGTGLETDPGEFGAIAVIVA